MSTMSKVDKQIDLEKRTNLKDINFDSLRNNKCLNQSQIKVGNFNQKNSNSTINNIGDSLQRQFKAQNELLNSNKLLKGTKLSIQEQSKNINIIGSPSNIINDRRNKSSKLIQNQIQNQHLSQEKLGINNQYSRNDLDPQNSQSLQIYQLHFSNSIKQTDNKTKQEQLNPKKSIISQDNKQTSKNSLQQISGKQILQNKLQANNDQTNQKQCQSMYNQTSNNQKESIIKGSVSMIQNQQQIIAISESPQKIKLNLQATQFSQTSSQILLTEAATKLFNCLYCYNQVESDSIQLSCLHNYHVQCLEEHISVQINQGKALIHCQCNIKIPQKFVLLHFSKNSQIKELFLKNQLQFLIKSFIQKNQDKKINYDSNPQIEFKNK
ncbi:unnamed protein product [Paramecium sonneborni]|uniref:RING-type domain-containing protein n=1 Tax=Paramecium sonneborni TaxID=65129 RepID=A0A8S1QYT8_9CILI|nr:unnamed protein product [Paramecium sonneborni]